MNNYMISQIKTNIQYVGNVIKMHMDCKVGEHGQIHLLFALKDKDAFEDKYVFSKNSEGAPFNKTVFSVWFEDEDGTKEDIFKGIPLKYSYGQLDRGTTRELLEIVLVSTSYQMEDKKIKRTFQSPKLKYKDLFEFIAKDKKTSFFKYLSMKDSLTKNIDLVIDERITDDIVLNYMSVQYDETNWEYLKRMASTLCLPVTPLHTTEKPYVIVGVPPQPVEKDFIEDQIIGTVEYSMDTIFWTEYNSKVIKENEVNPSEALVIKNLRSYQNLPFFAKTKIKGSEFYITRKTIVITESNEIVFSYELTFAKYLLAIPRFNEKIRGAVLYAQIISVDGDKVEEKGKAKVRFSIDLELDNKELNKEDKNTISMIEIDNAVLIPYPTIYANGNGGLHCSPEIGNWAYVKFGTEIERNVFIESYLKEFNQTDYPGLISLTNGDSSIQFRMTLTGIELVVYNKDAQGKVKEYSTIRVDEKNGISIYSDTGINIMSKEDITLSSEGRFTAYGVEKLSLKTNKSEILLNEQNVEVKGEKINFGSTN